MCTGPGRPSRAMRNASRNTHGICAASLHRNDFLTTGLTISQMSTAWKPSRCSWLTGTWPVIVTIGIESAIAV